MNGTSNYWTSKLERVGRRRFLAGAGTVALGAASVALVGCGDDDDDMDTPTSGETPSGPTPTAVEGITDYPTYTSVVKAAEYIQKYNWRNLPEPKLPPRRGGDYQQTVGLIPPHFDPIGPLVNSYAIPTNLRQIYNQLTRLEMEWDDNLDQANPEGELAENWEQVDDTTLVFNLREGVKFQDIDPVSARLLTSEDVKYTYEAYRDTPISGYFEAVDRIETPDDQTVRIVFSEPAAYFLNLISGPSTSILPVELDEQGRRENPVGTGPFQLKGGVFKPEQEVTYLRNPDYWEVRDGIQLPYLDKSTMLQPADPTVALEGFRDGQFDSSAYAFNFGLLDSVLESNPDTIVQVVSDHPSVIYHLGINNDNPKWKDERVRRAVAYAIDIQQLIDLGLEGAAAPGCLVDWASMGRRFPPTLAEMDDALGTVNIDKAKALLSEAGVSDLKFNILFSSTDTRGQSLFSLMKEQLAAAGIEANADTRDATSISNALYSGGVEDVIMTTQLPAGPDADVFTYQFLHSKGASNWYHVNDSDLDEITSRQRTILDVKERQGVIEDIWKLSMEKMYMIPLASAAFIRVKQPWLNNWQNHRYLDPLGWGAHLHGLMWFSDDAPADRKG
ncbi:MAG: ABC transporter substrate-binding protein [Dehalococcoidia bacterium]|nr:ABC transporter substrate-binding protein [Dehalococcoidia bacterium]